MKLRAYQQRMVDEDIGAFNAGIRSVCMQSGTGSGKTHTAAGLIEYAVGRGHRVVFAAHLDALVGDTHARLERTGVRAGFIQSGRPSDPTARVQVASLQTLHVRGERPPADLFILDECHRAMSASVHAILAAYPESWILGLTATPQRGDGKPLSVFQHLVTGPSNEWLTRQGFLVPCDVLAPAAFSEKALVDDPVKAYAGATPGKRAIVFASTVTHARKLAAQFASAGYPSACMLGDTPRLEREEMRVAMATGRLTVLVGVGVFIEGFDLPSIETVVLARGFTVTGAFLQAIGRGLRPSPETGKTRCTVLDLRGSVHLHGLPDDERVWSLTGKAVRRVDLTTPLRRCTECLAIFKVARCCPRCGAENKSAEHVPRVLTRPEKLAKWNEVPAVERDRRYLWRLQVVARTRMRMSPASAEAWALRQFEKRFGRKPEVAA